MTRQLSLLVLCCVVMASFVVIRLTQGEIQAPRSYDSIQRIRSIDSGEFPLKLHIAGGVITYYGETGDVQAGDLVRITGKAYDVRDESGRYFSAHYSRYLQSKGVFKIIHAKELTLIEKGGGIYFIRQRLLDSFQRNLDSMYGRHAPIVKALVYGDRSELSEELMEVFSRTGTTHILALSGFHVGILALLINLLLAKISVHQRGIIICMVLVCYAFLTGMKPSILRASLFFMLYYLAFVRRERYNLFAASCMSASILLVINPYSIYDLGFLLSFASVLSIALFYPMLQSRLDGFRYQKHFLTQTAVLSVAAQILTIPLTIYSFGRLSYVAVLANLFVIPVVSLMMGLSIVSLGLHYLTRPLPFLHLPDSGLSGLVEQLQIFLLRGNQFFANLPFAYTDHVSLGRGGLFLCYSVILGLYLLWEIHQIRENRYEPSRSLEILVEE